MEKTQKINPVRNKTSKMPANAWLYWISNGVKSVLSFVFVAVVFAALPAVASAATLHFSPSSGEYAVGKTFSISVSVSSADQAMNAASGVISFPRDKLEVTSLSKTGSFFSLWVQEPSFSNSTGTINFEGIVLNPGFSGSGGKIMTINFKVKATGGASLNFSSGSILANDGAGTNILVSMGSAQFSLGGTAPTAPIVPEATTPSAVSDTPIAPQVSSPTHPDPNKWYSDSNPKLSWIVPSGVTVARVMYDKFPNSTPSVVYSPAVSEKQLKNIEDGIYYFHVQLKNAKGWGETSHFRFQIDTMPPEPITISFVDGKVVEEPRVKIMFDTVDALSGIDYYSIKISGDFLPIISSTDLVTHNPYTLPPQSPGSYLLEVIAFDKAGNTATASDEFIIKPALPPQISGFPEQLNSGENLEIKGESVYPKANVVLFIQKDNDKPNIYQIITDQNGKFVYISKEPLQNGVYKLWAYITDEKGTQSNPSEKISINVSGSAILRVGTRVNSFLAVIIPLVALVFALLFIIWYGWHKFSLLRKRIRKEVREAESALHKAFDMLKEDIREQIKLLEKTRTKRQLTKEEDKIVKQLKKNLDTAEKFVRKEIEDIEKAVK